MNHVIFDRRVSDSGPCEGSLCCLTCKVREEIDALASEEEGIALHHRFAGRHAQCGAAIVAEVES